MTDDRAPDLLVFVEDPGAANYLAPLARGASGRGMTARLVTHGPATTYLRDRAIDAEAIRPGQSARALLAEVRPRVLVTGTSEDRDAIGLALVDAARELHVPSIGAVDGAANSAHRFRGRGDHALVHAPDWLMVPNDWTKASYVELGFPADRVTVCGHPHYDVVLDAKKALDAEGRAEIRRRLLPLAGDRAVLVFLTELSVGLNTPLFRRSADYTLEGHGGDERTGVVLDELLDAVALMPERPYLVLRIHPKDRAEGYPQHLAKFDLVSSGGSPLELVYAADLVVGMTSMLLLEAALLGRPTLSIVPRAIERDWLPSIGWGVTPCATSSAEVRAQVASLLGASDDRGRCPVPLVREGSTEFALSFLEARVKSGAE